MILVLDNVRLGMRTIGRLVGVLGGPIVVRVHRGTCTWLTRGNRVNIGGAWTAGGARFRMVLVLINVRNGRRTIGRLAGVSDDPIVGRVHRGTCTWFTRGRRSKDVGAWTVGGMFRCLVLPSEAFSF